MALAADWLRDHPDNDMRKSRNSAPAFAAAKETARIAFGEFGFWDYLAISWCGLGFLVEHPSVTTSSCLNVLL